MDIHKTALISSNDSTVTIYDNVLTADEAQEALDELSRTLPWKVETDDFGPQSRSTCYYGDSPECIFAYVGLRLTPLPWTGLLRKLRDRVAERCNISEQLLSGCLVNLYEENGGYIPWHYDEVRAHGDSKTVASLSLGGPRRFQLRPRTEPSLQNEEQKVLTADLLLESGSVLVMQGKTQEKYEHCLPLERGNAPLRISLTFRSIVPGWENTREMAKDACCTQVPGYVSSRSS